MPVPHQREQLRAGHRGEDRRAELQILTDSGFQDDCVGGLEAADPDAGEFPPVDPLPGTFLVNLGDVGTVMAFPANCQAGLLVSLCTASVALFLVAPKEDMVMVRAPEAFVSDERPRRFRTFGYGDYRRLRQSTGEHASA
ncbi:hypothetical protein ABZP36_032281 [Zizania latifolia]